VQVEVAVVVERMGRGTRLGAGLAVLGCALSFSACSSDKSSPNDPVGGSGGESGADSGLGGEAGSSAVAPGSGQFDRIELGTDFVAEGAAMGDLSGDGVADVVAGPFVYLGPEFEERHQIYTPVVASFDRTRYSDNFFAFVRDIDGDDDNDVLVIGFPGEDARWYDNPGSFDSEWVRHEVFAGVDTESPWFTDLTGDAEPELVFATAGQLGYAVAAADPLAPWEFHAISPPGPYVAFTHGLGVGDMTGDGRADVLEKTGYWEQPEDLAGDPVWTKHDFDFGAAAVGGAQMFAYDVDGDGDNDVITSLDAHGYGIALFQNAADSGAPGFLLRLLAGAAPGDGSTGIVLHEPHALDLADVNGDGLLDIITGERFWGHYPGGDASLDDPALLYWFELRRDAPEAHFIPHAIDTNSGVGTQVSSGDLSDDGLLDVVISNKKGSFVFRQRPNEPSP
jgi:hypothetical protein